MTRQPRLTVGTMCLRTMCSQNVKLLLGANRGEGAAVEGAGASWGGFSIFWRYLLFFQTCFCPVPPRDSSLPYAPFPPVPYSFFSLFLISPTGFDFK